jgi:hypothetical protein
LQGDLAGSGIGKLAALLTRHLQIVMFVLDTEGMFFVVHEKIGTDGKEKNWHFVYSRSLDFEEKYYSECFKLSLENF